MKKIFKDKLNHYLGLKLWNSFSLLSVGFLARELVRRDIINFRQVRMKIRINHVIWLRTKSCASGVSLIHF